MRDGPRWQVDTTFLNARVPKEKGPEQQLRSKQQVLVGDEMVRLMMEYDPATNVPSRINGMTAIRSDRIANRTRMQLGPAKVLFGCTAGDAGFPIWTIMREASSLEVLPQTEVIDGAETYVLKSRGKYGEHQVWLDPAKGGLPRRIVVQKQPGDILNDEQLGAAPAPATEQNGRRRPEGVPPRSAWTTQIEKIQIENVDGVFVTIAYGEESITTYANKRTFKTNQILTFDATFPNTFAESAFKFEMPIPNGTRVFVMDNYPIEWQGTVKANHEWVNGTIRDRVGN